MLQTGFWMFAQPRAIVGSVVEHNVGQTQEAVLLSGDMEQFFDLCDTSVLLEVGFFVEHRRVVGELVSDRVRTVALPAFLNRSPVNHIVSSILCLLEVVPPTGDRTHPFGNKREHGDTIQWKVDISRFQVALGVDHKVRRKDRNARFYEENGIDVEVAFPTFDAGIGELPVKLNPVHERTSA